MTTALELDPEHRYSTCISSHTRSHWTGFPFYNHCSWLTNAQYCIEELRHLHVIQCFCFIISRKTPAVHSDKLVIFYSKMRAKKILFKNQFIYNFQYFRMKFVFFSTHQSHFIEWLINSIQFQLEYTTLLCCANAQTIDSWFVCVHSIWRFSCMKYYFWFCFVCGTNFVRTIDRFDKAIVESMVFCRVKSLYHRYLTEWLCKSLWEQRKKFEPRKQRKIYLV